MSRRRTAGLFILCVSAGVLVVVGHSLKRYYLDKDYLVTATTACDPMLHSCFKTDPANPDPNLPIPIYEKVEVSAADAPRCLDEHTCPSFSCEQTKTHCTITYCSKDTEADGEVCTRTQ